MKAQERFAKFTELLPTGCIVWTGTLDIGGYGSFYLSGKARKAHRVAWEWRYGPVPAGLQLDHLCRVRNCVNTQHLEPVTRKENILRGEGQPAKNARKTRCRYGHPLDSANTLLRPEKGRECLICKATLAAKWRSRRSAHRVVADKMLGRRLTRMEVVLHKNGDKSDNRPENLEVVPKSEQMRRHMTGNEGRRRGALGNALRYGKTKR